ncbi:MAG: hypothetical protein WCI57_02360 [Candidatus Berkelbacteria bacterium]
MENKPKINPVEVFFIILIVIEIFWAGIVFFQAIANEPSRSSISSADQDKLLDQNNYYEIVNPSLSATNNATTTNTIKSPFELLK